MVESARRTSAGNVFERSGGRKPYCFVGWRGDVEHSISYDGQSAVGHFIAFPSSHGA